MVLVTLVHLLLIMDKVIILMVVMEQPPAMPPGITKASALDKATVKAMATAMVIMDLIITNLTLLRRTLTTLASSPVILVDVDMVVVAMVVAVVVVVVETALDKDILNHPQMQYSYRHFSVDRNAISTRFQNSTPKSSGMSSNSRPRQSVAHKVSDAFLILPISPALIPKMKPFRSCESSFKLYSSIRLTPPWVNLLFDVTVTVATHKHAGKTDRKSNV